MRKGKNSTEKEIMSFRVPDFMPQEDNPVFPYKIHESAGDDVAELIWQKGPFLRRRSPDPPHGDYALRFLSDPCAASGVSTHTAAAAASLPSATELFMEEDEMASWLYYPLGGDDDAGGVGTVAGTEQPREAAAAALPEKGFFPPAAVERAVEADGWATTGWPPRHPQRQGMSTGCLGSPLPPPPPPASRESTVVNATATTTTSRPGAQSRVSSGDARVGAAACELGPASSSGLSCDGEEAGAGAASMAAGRGDERKRRIREDDGCDSHSEDVDGGELESSGAGKRRDSGRSATARKARAAQVHNLSERRRRDRINEKMKALQQLIPRCHKSDKASMLDDAIEYIKSLQMQVQMMSMCCNMTPMMFPGVQQYMPSMGMGMPAMGMNMGIMGVGMAMRMDMSSTGRGLGHPMMPCSPTVLPAAQMAAPANGAPHLTQRPPGQLAAHAPVAALAEQMRLQAANHADPASSSTCITTPGALEIAPKLPGFLHRARSHEDPASATAAEPGISRRTCSMPDKSRLGN